MPTREGTPTGPSDPQSEQGGTQARDHPKQSFGGVDVNKPKDELLADAERAGISGRSDMTKEKLAAELQRHNDRETRRARG